MKTVLVMIALILLNYNIVGCEEIDNESIAKQVYSDILSEYNYFNQISSTTPFILVDVANAFKDDCLEKNTCFFQKEDDGIIEDIISRYKIKNQEIVTNIINEKTKMQEALRILSGDINSSDLSKAADGSLYIKYDTNIENYKKHINMLETDFKNNISSINKINITTKVANSIGTVGDVGSALNIAGSIMDVVNGDHSIWNAFNVTAAELLYDKIPIIRMYNTYSAVFDAFSGEPNLETFYTQTLPEVISKVEYWKSSVLLASRNAGYEKQKLTLNDKFTLMKEKYEIQNHLERLQAKMDVISALGALDVVFSGKQETYLEFIHKYKAFVREFKKSNIVDTLYGGYTLGVSQKFEQDTNIKLEEMSDLNKRVLKIKGLHEKLKEVSKVNKTYPKQPSPTPQPVPATSITLILSEKEITAGTEKSVYFSASTNNKVAAVIVIASKNGIKEQDIDLASANGEKWTSAMTAFKTPGDYMLIASARDKSGKIICSSSSIALTVKPAAVVKEVRSSVDSVALGGNVEFTASVQGVVGSNAQVILKLDLYESVMTHSGNVWKKTVNISEVNAEGKRTYTAYVKDNGIAGEGPPAKTLNVTSPVNIDSVEAKMYGQPVSGCALHDKVDFFAKISGGVVPDKVVFKLDNFTTPMTQSTPGVWWVQVPIDQTNGGMRTYSVHTEKSGLVSNYATPKNLTVRLTNATLSVEAQDSNGNRVDTVNLNDQVHFIVNITGEANGPVKVRIGDWTVPQALVRQGSSKKWKTVAPVPMQQVGTRHYHALLEINGQEAAKSTQQQIEISRADGLQCPAVAKTGDWINAEMLVDNTKTIVKTTSKVKVQACDGRSGDTKIQFDKAGYGWVWPGYRVAASDCGTFEFIADTKTGTAIKTYRCTTRVNMDSQLGPPTSEPQPQVVIESSTYTEALTDGFLKLKVKVTQKKNLGVLMVRAVFPEGGIQTVSKDYSNELVVMQLHQEGVDEWAVRLKYPGKRIVPYTIEFSIDGRRIATAPGAFYPGPQEYKLTPADVRISKTRINHASWEINVDLLKEPPQSPNPELIVNVVFLEGMTDSRGVIASEIMMAKEPTGKKWRFIAQVPGERSMPFNIKFYQAGGEKPLMITAGDFIPAEPAPNDAVVKSLYQSFANYYNAKNDSRLRSLISDDWESDGDGTTLSDLEMNLRSSFRIFDQIGCTISNLQITTRENGKFVARYDITIKGTIFKNNIRHEEKTSVTEEVSVDDSGKARITKTLNGRFWYVQ